MKHSILTLFTFLCLFILSASLSAQNEVELRPDGIVVPRTTPGAVSSPVEGMLIYDTSIDAYQYYDGSVWSLIGVFERSGTLVRQKAGLDFDVFIFGRNSLPPSGSITDKFFFFDKSKAAFRGGIVKISSAWAPDSLGSVSFAYGFNTNASGNFGATALGSQTTASGDDGATALGRSTTASGDFGATALGYATEATGDNSTVVGRYNDTIVAAGQDITPTSPLFIVGNGDNGFGNQSNALVVRKDGLVRLQNYAFPIPDGSANQVMTTDGSGQLSWNPNTDDWSNNASNIYYNVGNVGIGTSTPTSKLHINYNSLGSSPQIQLSEIGSDGARINFENDQTTNNWTLYGRPKVDNATSEFNIYYESNEGGGTSGNKLKIFGNGDATLAGILTQSSDRRLKTDIVPLENALDKLLAIHGYTYHWKTDQVGVNKKIGVMAQEVQQVLPDLILEDEDGYLSVSYTSLVPVLIEGMREQQEEIEMQREVNSKQADEIETQSQELSALRQYIDQELAKVKASIRN